MNVLRQDHWLQWLCNVSNEPSLNIMSRTQPWLFQNQLYGVFQNHPLVVPAPTIVDSRTIRDLTPELISVTRDSELRLSRPSWTGWLDSELIPWLCTEPCHSSCSELELSRTMDGHVSDTIRAYVPEPSSGNVQNQLSRTMDGSSTRTIHGW